MRKINEFDIQIATLSNKVHEYDFVLDNNFFALFDQNLVNGGNLRAHVMLDKTDLLLQFEFKITGTVNVTCDRSLDEFDYPVELDELLLVRYGAVEAELDDNILQILPGTQAINIAQHLFDYIGLAIPIKKLHPRFYEVDEDPDAENILIYSSGGLNQDTDDEDDDAAGDPRWDALKKLK
ncbi:YceD family protein [Adhaeribacter radiodurans]|uniref:DUF177 domain-containing protein n=1 Tax=Adhaeribacter radiodurans TaxID=2745197 RepID=A0A7L7L519_9BACT|nr:DUF177 domain-containing protein [Adhaeribacter radiodurans]QMU27896.1 DUF177 domain-containing protein [Adhaeribacter radiodurans]